MDQSVLAWLLAQLGPSTDHTDLATRYARLGTARSVAAEILAERRARLLAEPLRLVVDGVITTDNTANLAGLERQLASLADAIAPDDPAAAEDGHQLVTAQLIRSRTTR
ncbi:hypothetical protein E6W39_29075 [Kitasatospora acidiphila]|uniref:Uncharacterized protein n=1 Tax=Kitasatospora acidiphila TaxID=2567942 RepID=A0A540W954_9ACTN|nr:hypothetical protein [Kitasatospora acidiphila]TQF05541.1 hypothetical protein E6W39_29075 [Kitasatospora acidiphila]